MTRMSWATPQYTRNQVDNAGFRLVDPDVDVVDYINAIDVITNWRSSHSYPLNTFQNTLRSRSAAIAKNVDVAQRIKRLASIEAKLKRFTSMQLSQVQDIGGCRAVLSNVEHVNRLASQYRNNTLSHKLRNEKNYIDNPKKDGYRSIHFVFQYVGTERSIEYNDLRIEVQIRSKLQHAWATAVETVDTFTRQALKSNMGRPDWQRFFALASSSIANYERTSRVPDTPVSPRELRSNLRDCAEDLGVLDTLKAFSSTLQHIEKTQNNNFKYFLIQIKPDERKVSLRRFSKSQSQQANEEYSKLETEQTIESGRQVCLVSADSIQSLRRAYPNYFGETTTFSAFLRQELT